MSVDVKYRTKATATRNWAALVVMESTRSSCSQRVMQPAFWAR